MISEDNLRCSFCNKKYDGDIDPEYGFLDLGDVAKRGWIVDDFGLFCSEKCYSMYMDEISLQPEDFVKEGIQFSGRRYVGINSVVFDNTVVGFPDRINIYKNIAGKATEYSEVVVGENALIRPGTVIYEGVTIGNNFESGHGVLILEHTFIGDNVRVGSYTVIEGDVYIGNNVNIQSFVYIPKNVHIGNDVFIAPRVTFTNDKYPPFDEGGLQSTDVGNCVSIGACATISPGVTIGEYSLRQVLW
jgi:UDP-3-O-[3-hydroxymyristoyl] glucosamine N-acyltransferase